MVLTIFFIKHTKKLLIFLLQTKMKITWLLFGAMLFWMGNKKKLIALISIFLGYGRTL